MTVFRSGQFCIAVDLESQVRQVGDLLRVGGVVSNKEEDIQRIIHDSLPDGGAEHGPQAAFDMSRHAVCLGVWIRVVAQDGPWEGTASARFAGIKNKSALSAGARSGC